jgi:hypothetical protein
LGGRESARREAPIKIQHAAKNRPETQGEAMTCDHEPEDRVFNEPTTCRHCHVEIEPAACAECHGMEFVTDDEGREIDCTDCNGTGCDGWRAAR